jgi:uncharacterized protein (DUF1015 family)
MAKITPFRGVVFNQEKAGAITNLVCPPYDIISSQEREKLYRKSPHNVVRLEFGKENPADNQNDNRYTRAAFLLEDWIKNDVLCRDQAPSLYVYEMEYTIGTVTKKLRGFVSLVRLEEYASGIIKPHETTLSGPKTDRLNLLRACKAGFSQIYSLFSDPQNRIATVLASVTRSPDQEVKADDNVIHRIWSMNDTQSIEAIVRELADKPLFIADGHHRYDTALNYRNEQRAALGTYTGDEPFNYTAMFLARLEDPGLTILPAHRAVFNLGASNLPGFKDALNEYFRIERIDCKKETEDKDLTTILDTMAHRTERAHVIGMRIKGENSYYLLTLRNEADMAALLPKTSAAYQHLDVSILHHLIIDKLLGIKMETHKLGQNIEYIKEAKEAIKRVRDGAVDIVFLLNPTKVGEIKDVALAGERMPQKATYFYPKLVTGLVMNKLDES